MPPKKLPTTNESGDTRVVTRASNANKHPGIAAKNTLQVQTRRDPEEIKADKERKKAAKAAKEEAHQAEIAQREMAKQNLEASRARQAATLEEEDNMFPQQQSKGKSALSSVLSLTLLGGLPFNRRQRKHTSTFPFRVSC